MFPELEDDIATIIESEESEKTAFNGKSFLFDFNKGDFIYRNGNLVEVSGIEALKIWIEKIIRTERFKFNIYEDVSYGVTIQDLIGSSLPEGFVESELKRELSESILTNPFIDDLLNWEFISEGSTLTIKFDVETNDELFSMEMMIK